MVTIQRETPSNRRPPSQTTLIIGLVILSIVALYLILTTFPVVPEDHSVVSDVVGTATGMLKPRPTVVHLEPPLPKGHLDSALVEKDNEKPDIKTADRPSDRQCAYQRLSDLSNSERNPKSDSRHSIDPPSDSGGTVSLVCCRTTVGPLSILAHSTWAPLGAKRFLDMVRDDYFSTRVPLMRCIKNFLCQFGIAGDPDADKKWKGSFPDDPQWLKKGPAHRENSNGVKRFARGYLAYAGAGANSRSNQFIVALVPSGPLGGGSPWEVPWGELVHMESFLTLGKIYTGYGDNGPGQALLHNEGASEYVEKTWPKLDYVVGCEILDEENVP